MRLERVDGGLPVLVAAVAVGAGEALGRLRPGRADGDVRVLERLPAVRECARRAGRERGSDHGDDKHHSECDPRARADLRNDRHEAVVLGQRCAKPEQRDAGAHDDEEQQQLVALVAGKRGLQPIRQRVALLDAGDQDGGAGRAAREREERRDTPRRERNEHERARRDRERAATRDGQVPAEAEQRDRCRCSATTRNRSRRDCVEERDRHTERDQSGQPIPVVQRIREAGAGRFRGTGRSPPRRPETTRDAAATAQQASPPLRHRTRRR